MHFMSQENQLVYLFFICMTQTIFTPINSVLTPKQCNGSETNCTLNTSTLSTIVQNLTTSNSDIKGNPYSINLKIIAIAIAVICLGIGIVRVCFLLCNSPRSSNNQLPNRRRSTVRPQIATIEQNQFKPDLPPAYAEATANIDLNENKLPSYDELHNERQSPSAMTTQI